MDDCSLESIADFRKALGDIGRSTAYRIFDAGEVETVHVGKRRMIVKESRQKYIEKLRSTRGGV